MSHAQDIQIRDGVAVVVYSKPDCRPCTFTKRKLNAAGIHFTEVDVTQDPAALGFVKALGYTGAPVVYVSTIEGDVHWYGLDVPNIEKHITHRADAA